MIFLQLMSNLIKIFRVIKDHIHLILMLLLRGKVVWNFNFFLVASIFVE